MAHIRINGEALKEMRGQNVCLLGKLKKVIKFYFILVYFIKDFILIVSLYKSISFKTKNKKIP